MANSKITKTPAEKAPAEKTLTKHASAQSASKKAAGKKAMGKATGRAAKKETPKAALKKSLGKTSQEIRESMERLEKASLSDASGDGAEIFASWAENIVVRSQIEEMVIAIETLCIKDAPPHFETVWDSLMPKLKALHTADLADVIERLSSDARQSTLSHLSPIDAGILPHIEEDLRPQVIRFINPNEVVKILNQVESDDAIEIISGFEDSEQRDEIMQALSGRRRKILELALSYPETSAGRMLRGEFVAAPATWQVGRMIEYLRSRKNDQSLPDHFYCVVLVDKDFHPQAVVSLSSLMQAEPKTTLTKLAKKEEIHIIPITAEQSDVAHLFQQYGLVEAPVVDEEGALAGTITLDDIIEVINEVNKGDMLGLGGLASDDIYKDALQTTMSRFGWLFVNLLTAILASLIIAIFADSIAEVVALAVLMPIVASMGGNAGTQTLTIAVRGLATNYISRANQDRIMIKELLVAFANGCLFAIILATGTWYWYEDLVLAFVIAAAIIINMITAGLLGVLIPLMLDRLKLDPAVGSSVILTTFTDSVGFFVFLGLATLLLL